MTSDRHKRLLYRSNYRGFKEADILLGGFVKANIGTMSDAEVDEFETLLMSKDHDIYDWITDAQPLPPQFDTPLFARLKAYRPAK